MVAHDIKCSMLQATSALLNYSRLVSRAISVTYLCSYYQIQVVKLQEMILLSCYIQAVRVPAVTVGGKNVSLTAELR
jgi:hypothetical protein